MNPDLVADERAQDEKRNPDERLVIEGPALKQLRHGDILRGGVHYNVDYDGPDNTGFRWHPDDFRLPVDELLLRYDKDIAADFVARAKDMRIAGTTVWSWLRGAKLETRPRAERARDDQRIAGARQRAAASEDEPASGLTVRDISTRPEFEEKIRDLPNEEGLAWDANGKFITHRFGDGMEVQFSKAETARMAGGTATHNHPSGRPPSPTDYRFAILNDLAETRVVTPDGVWVVRRPAGGWPGKTREERAAWGNQIIKDIAAAAQPGTANDLAHEWVVLFRHFTGASVRLE